ncbi:phage baseplate protein [Pararhizobium sp.]|uniref:phage baseplate protein n=1 Tax=Pararhizobium sp. TaxID=1977563 RepID=UPI00271C7D74|nr:hypothetical protein [Pararhizobium sp.]MDO9417039.1 hypothetical protein [Pararhizobium sp.]
MSAIAFSHAIGPVFVDCVVSEKHASELDITEIPIETGAKITDHAIVVPKKITLDVASNKAAATYAAMVRFQESRVPFVLVTGLSVYRNMLIKRIDADRDATFSTVLRCRIDLQEIIIVGTSYAADPNGEPGRNGQADQGGNPGGSKSLKAAKVSPERARDGVTADRATGTVQRGDAGVTTVPAGQDQSIIRGLFN